MKLWFDFETFSTVPIRRGTDAYLNGARPLLLSYAVDDGPVIVHDFTENPGGLPVMIRALFGANELWAHNVYFDRLVLSRCLGIDLPIERFRCSYALALLHGLPGGLEPLGRVLSIPVDLAKIEDGKRLIRKFCGPKPFVKDQPDWDLFKEYAANDVSSMRECVRAMPQWNADLEREVWQTDQIINNRGFQIDEVLAAAAVKMLQANKAKLAEATFFGTSGVVASATQRDKLQTYICETQGYFLPDMTASTINAALENEDLDPAVRNILEIRLQSAKSSTSKFQRLLDSAGTDNRLRGTLQYSGAGRTARWAGRIFQPQNLPRPTMEQADIKLSIGLIREGREDLLSLLAPVSEACSNALRGLIVAAPGKRLLVGDWSAIEGRANAWLAGEDWKVKAFSDKKNDLYKMIYALAFGISVDDVTKLQRQMGKVMELALGYGGGVGAFVSMAAGYGMDLEEMAKSVTPNPKANDAWEWALKKNQTYGLSQEVYVACDTLKIGYRKANPQIQRFWAMLEAAARNAIESGQRSQVGPVIIDGNRNWMRIKLPSGRFLCYALPKIGTDGTISYMAWQNKQWRRVKTYGGKFDENICQAVCRDLLAHTLIQLEHHGYPVVLHIHDEPIAEVPNDGPQTLDEYIKLMCLKPGWAAGLPLSAEGFEGNRYEK